MPSRAFRRTRAPGASQDPEEPGRKGGLCAVAAEQRNDPSTPAERRWKAVRGTAQVDKSKTGVVVLRLAMSQDPSPEVTNLMTAVRVTVNIDGGWGYAANRSSRLEPSCWALLTLLKRPPGVGEGAMVDRALSLLIRSQRADGLVSDLPGASPNLAVNALCAIVLQYTLATREREGPALERAANALLVAIAKIKGVRFSESPDVRQDNELAGWPWIEETFSWVEPTAWCLLALKKARGARRPPGANSRIAEADRLLADRCCASGGWNYGNSNVLGRQLHAYVPTTAVSLLALQDRRELPEVQRSVEWLAANWHREASPQALSLARIAMRVHGKRGDDVDRILHSVIADRGVPDNFASAAITLYALTGTIDDYAALRL